MVNFCLKTILFSQIFSLNGHTDWVLITERKGKSWMFSDLVFLTCSPNISLKISYSRYLVDSYLPPIMLQLLQSRLALPKQKLVFICDTLKGCVSQWKEIRMRDGARRTQNVNPGFKNSLWTFRRVLGSLSSSNWKIRSSSIGEFRIKWINSFECVYKG